MARTDADSALTTPAEVSLPGLGRPLDHHVKRYGERDTV